MQKIDAIVIGGGAIGTFHALHLLRAGKTVVQIERHSKPYSSTVQNFGQVVASGMKRGFWQEMGFRSTEIYKELQQHIDLGIRNNGSLYVASTPEEFQVLVETAEYFASIGYPNTLLSKAETLAKQPYLQTNYVQGGLFFPTEVTAEPRFTIYQIQQLLSSFNNYKLVTNTFINNVEEGSNGVVVTDAYGTKYLTEKVFVCTGGEFRALFPQLFLTSNLMLVKLNMLLTEPMPEIKLPGSILTGLTIRRYDGFKSAASYAKLKPEEVSQSLKDYGVHILFKQALDGSIIIGDSHEYADAGNEESLDFFNDNHINDLMLNEAKRILNLPSWAIRYQWNGFYAQHKTEEVFTHTIGKNIHICCGIGGKGMTTSAGFTEQHIAGIYSR
jgi:FAD dependent oxidoreductase TIGR03364